MALSSHTGDENVTLRSPVTQTKVAIGTNEASDSTLISRREKKRTARLGRRGKPRFEWGTKSQAWTEPKEPLTHDPGQEMEEIAGSERGSKKDHNVRCRTRIKWRM